MVLKFSKEQFDGLETRVTGHWDADTAAELYGLYTPYFINTETDVAQLTEFCRTVRDYATAYQIQERKDIYKLIVMALALGAHFCHDPRYGAMLEDTLLKTTMPSGRRVHLLGTDVDALLRGRKKAGGLSAFGTYLGKALQGRALQMHAGQTGNDVILHLLGQLPLVDDVSNADLATFVGFCLPHCDAYGLRDLEQRFAYCACAVVHGVYWFDDPVMAALRDRLVSAAGGSDLAETLATFYERFA